MLSKRFWRAVRIILLFTCSLRLTGNKSKINFDVFKKTGVVLSLVFGLAVTSSFANAKSDSDFTSYLYRLEAIRDRALTYAYYLRSAYLKKRANHLISSDRNYMRARNDVFESVFLLEKSLEYSPNSSALWMEYANLNGQLGRISKVIQSYEHLIKLSPDNITLQERIVDLYIQLAFKNTRSDKYKLAQTQFIKAREKLKILIDRQKKAEYMLKEGLLCELLGMPGNALEAYQTAISLAPDIPDAYIRSSRIYCAMGDYDYRAAKPEIAKTNYLRAAEFMLKVVPLRNNKSELLNFTAYLLALSGEKLDYAEELVKEALKKDKKNSAYIDTLGWILFKQGNVNEALEKLLHANQIGGDDPVTTEHLGDVFFKLGKNEKAKEMWEISLFLDSNNISVKNKLNELNVK